MIDYRKYVHYIRPILYNKAYSNKNILDNFINIISSSSCVDKAVVSYTPFTIYIYFNTKDFNQDTFTTFIRNNIRDIIILLERDILQGCDQVLPKLNSAKADPNLLYQAILDNVDIICNINYVPIEKETAVVGVVIL